MAKMANIFIYFVVFGLSLTQAEDVTIGAFYGEFTDVEDVYKRIVEDAMQHVNPGTGGTVPIFGPGDQLRVTQFQPTTINNAKVFSTNVYQALQLDVCAQTASSGVKAIIVPNDLCTSCKGIGGTIGDAVNPTMATDMSQMNSQAIKMYPPVHEMISLLTELVNYTKWVDFVVLYDKDSANNVAEAMMDRADQFGWSVRPYQIQDIEELKKILHESTVKNILLFCEYEEVAMRVIKEAIDDRLMTDAYHWILGNLNVPLTWDDVDKIRLQGAYVTRLQILTKPNVAFDYNTQKAEPIDEWQYRLRLTYDSVITLGRAFLQHKEKHGSFPRHFATCPPDPQNPSISTAMTDLKSVAFEGLSGHVAFNELGDRVNYTIQIYMGKGRTVYVHNDVEEVRPLGHWTQNIRAWERLHGRRWESQSRLNMGPFRNAEIDTITIVSLEEPPYLIDTGRGFEGFIPEFLKLIKKVMREQMDQEFEYELELVSEGDYGRFDVVTRKWSGMMGRLVDGYADIAAAPLAVTSERDGAVDFTVPYMKADLGILIKHPSGVREYPFAIVFPFGWDAWLANLAALVVVVILFIVIGSFNPREWKKAAGRGEVSEEDADSFNFWNSWWFSITSVFLQSYDKSPRSFAGRTLAAFWWLYVLMIMFLYLLNLSPFLKVSKTSVFIRDVGDLLHQSTVDIGFVKNSPAEDYFKYSDVIDYRRLWEHIHSANSMHSDDSTIEEEVEDAVQRVRHSNGEYAFIHDRRILEHESQRWPCNLYITGGNFAQVMYGLAVPSGSPLRDQLSFAIKELLKTDVLEQLWRNHSHGEWVEKGKGGKCDERLDEWERQGLFSLTSVDLKGVYYMMLLGFAFSIIFFVIEVLAFQLGFAPASPARTRGRPSYQHDEPLKIVKGHAAPPPAADDDQKMWI